MLKITIAMHQMLAPCKSSLYRGTLLLLLLFGLLVVGGRAQRKAPSIMADPSLPGRDTAHEPEQDPHQEMLEALEVKRAEGAHKQSIERARESAQLSAELCEAYTRQKALSPVELKKLARLEKLTRQLRSGAGGDDDDEQLKNPPGSLQAALERIAELANEMCKRVEKTPRQIVSVSMITQSNELLELIRLARSFSK